MRAVLLLALALATSGIAVAQVVPATGCGPGKTKFEVKTARVAPPPPTSDSGKAVVYFFQDDSQYNATPRPTTRFGIDGTWIGATHRDSYFYVAVDPGEHHVCASRQSSVAKARKTAATHFTAEAGKTYYFRVRDIWLWENKSPLIQKLEFSQIESEEAGILMNS